MKRIVVCCAALLLASGGAASADQVAAESFVAIRRDTALRVKPKRDARKLPPAVSDEFELGLAMYADYRWIAEHGDFVEVETVDPARRDLCHGGEAAFDGLALRLFVRKADLSPVVVRAFTAKYPNGSQVTVHPGEAVTRPRRGKSGTVLLPRVAGIAVKAPAGSIGLVHPAGRPAETKPMFWRKISGKIGANELTFLRGEISQLSPGKRKRTSLVVLRSRCDELTLLVDRSPAEIEADIDEYADGDGEEAGIGGIVGGVLGNPQVVDVPAAATLYHPDGAVAGATRRSTMLLRQEVTEKADRVCWQHRLDRMREGGASMPLCAERAAVTFQDQMIPPPPPPPPSPTKRSGLFEKGPILAPAWVNDEANKIGLHAEAIIATVCVGAGQTRPKVTRLVRKSRWPRFDAHVRKWIESTWRLAPEHARPRKVQRCETATLKFDFP